MRHDGIQRVWGIVGAHRDAADFVFAVNFIWQSGFDFNVERAVRNVDLQTIFANRRDMFLVDIDEGDVVSGTRQPAADDAADRADADDDDAIGHIELLGNGANILRSRKQRQCERAIAGRLLEDSWIPGIVGCITTTRTPGKGDLMKRVILAILFVLALQQSAPAAERIRIGYSSISGAYTPIWVAHDAGYFAKEGLADDIILIPSGTQLAQVTVAGEIDIGSLNRRLAIAAGVSRP